MPEKPTYEELVQRVHELEETENALRESEEGYRVLFEGSTLGILITDMEMGRFVDANLSFCRMFGYSKEDLFRLGIADLHPKDSLDHLMSDIKSQERGEQSVSRSIPCMRKDGTVFYADIVGANTIVHGRKCIVGFFLDITERKRAEEMLRESEEKYRILFSTSKDAVFITTREGNVVEANQSHLDLFGYSMEEISEFNSKGTYINPRDRSRFQKEIEENGFVKEFEVRLRKKDGSEMDCLITATVRRSKDGSIVGYHGTIRDVTEIKKGQEERERLISELQRTLSEVKTLRGFLPICSHCKKIRDDKGYWNQIESYIHKHSDAEFSHGICPECAKKYYPDMDLYNE